MWLNALIVQISFYFQLQDNEGILYRWIYLQKKGSVTRERKPDITDSCDKHEQRHVIPKIILMFADFVDTVHSSHPRLLASHSTAHFSFFQMESE